MYVLFTKYEEKEAEIGADRMRELERIILLRVVDNKWMDHIDDMDQLKSGIGLRTPRRRASRPRSTAPRENASVLAPPRPLARRGPRP